MSDEMRIALEELQALMKDQVDAVLDRNLTANAPWAVDLGAEPTDSRARATWHRSARIIAVYRDRYQVTTDNTTHLAHRQQDRADDRLGPRLSTG